MRHFHRSPLPAFLACMAFAAALPGHGEARAQIVISLAQQHTTATRVGLTLANLADILWQAGKKKDALDTFNKLRPLCAQADLDQPVFTRLRPIAEELKLPTDWRPSLAWPADSGQRPEIASLGPFRWHPYDAPGLKFGEQEVALASHRGASEETRDGARVPPTLVLFYLGSDCVRCIEQLNAFGAVAREFTDAGIRIVAIGSDPAHDLHKTSAKAKDNDGFPFPILSDSKLAAFKAFRAFDDFENIPLHGAFLIDGAGKVRWQDISYRPFTQAKWLLAEAKRLLALKGNAVAAE